MATGFCGSLSTVSTFVAEARAIAATPRADAGAGGPDGTTAAAGGGGGKLGAGRWDAARYVLATFAAAQLLLLPINGVPRWGD